MGRSNSARRAEQLGVALLLGLVSFLPGRPARAAGPAAPRFAWTLSEEASSCTSEAELRAQVAETLGYDVFGADTGPSLHGEMRRDGDAFVVSIELEFADGTPERRELRAPVAECASLSRAAALVIALAVEGATPPPKPEPTAPKAPNPPKASAPTAPTLHPFGDAAAPREPARSGWSHALDVLAVARWSLGVLPRPTTGLGALARYRLGGRWSLALGGDLLPRASERGRFSMGLVGGRASACFDWLRLDTFGAASCASALVGALTVRDEAAQASRAGTSIWSAGALSAEALAFLGSSWVFSAGLEAAVPFERPIYRASGCPLVAFQQPWLVAGLHAGLGTSFF